MPHNVSIRQIVSPRRWAKRWNTGVHTATHDIIFARTSGEPGSPVGITAFLVPLAAPGFDVEFYWWTFNMPSDHAEVSLTDVRVGADAVFGRLDHGLELWQGGTGSDRPTNYLPLPLNLHVLKSDIVTDFREQYRDRGLQIGKQADIIADWFALKYWKDVKHWNKERRGDPYRDASPKHLDPYGNPTYFSYKHQWSLKQLEDILENFLADPSYIRAESAGHARRAQRRSSTRASRRS